jgi:hypothetical protein
MKHNYTVAIQHKKPKVYKKVSKKQKLRMNASELLHHDVLFEAETNSKFLAIPNEYFKYRLDLPFAIKSISMWRMQWIKYLFKPKQVILDACTEFINTYLVRLQPWSKQPESLLVSSHPPINCISMHIRHGDKDIEMRLLKLMDYMNAAEVLVDTYGLSRNILLATDSQQVITRLRERIPSRRNFTFYYLNYDRANDAEGSAVNFAAKHNIRYNVVISTISDLLLGSHPNVGGFVQTTNSNFDRIVNELRRSDGKRTQYPHIDLNPGEF